MLGGWRSLTIQKGWSGIIIVETYMHERRGNGILRWSSGRAGRFDEDRAGVRVDMRDARIGQGIIY